MQRQVMPRNRGDQHNARFLESSKDVGQADALFYKVEWLWTKAMIHHVPGTPARSDEGSKTPIEQRDARDEGTPEKTNYVAVVAPLLVSSSVFPSAAASYACFAALLSAGHPLSLGRPTVGPSDALASGPLVEIRVAVAQEQPARAVST